MKIIGKIAQKTRISHARQLKYGVIILKKSSIKAKIHFLFFLIFFGVWTFSKDFKGFYGKIVKKKAQKSEISRRYSGKNGAIMLEKGKIQLFS